jgi:hypothetical protein
MEITHLTWATISRKAAFPTEQARRAVTRAMAAAAGKVLVLFALVDDHVHAVVAVEPGGLRRVQASLSRVLSGRSAVPLAAPYAKPVVTRKHMETLVGYCLDQFTHHGLADDPASASGSCFPDLVGARVLPGLSLQITTVLPRFQLREAYAAVGLSQPLQPASHAEVRALGSARLVDLVAATFAVGPDLRGRRAEVVLVRRVTARLALDAGLRPRDLGEALGVCASTLNRLATAPVNDADLVAVRLRIALVRAVAERGPGLVRDSASSSYVAGAAGGVGSCLSRHPIAPPGAGLSRTRTEMGFARYT